ncbi:MAG: FRG domain-containing protein [Chloroflexota bacterium]|nr:FRG domain-containing protein [Chloroflexota bacterium]
MLDCETTDHEFDPFCHATEPFGCAQKFVDRLIELNDQWEDDGGWIFRGQNDAKWELEPTLFRKWKPEYGENYEFRLIDNFIKNANLIHMDIPSNAMSYSTYYRNRVPATALGLIDSCTGNGLVYDYSHAVFAIAQHSGIPTRLLDFSYSALVAAFFAYDTSSLLDRLDLSNGFLAGCFEEIVEIYEDSPSEAMDALRCHYRKYRCDLEKIPEEMAVWALKLNALEPKTSLRVLNHPHAENSNLRAQDGLFVYHRDIISLSEEYRKDSSSFSEELLKLELKTELKKLTLVCSEAAELWKLLARKKMGYMYIYPNYENVAKSVLQGQNKWLSKQPECE